jgi:hypothetical protein
MDTTPSGDPGSANEPAFREPGGSLMQLTPLRVSITGHRFLADPGAVRAGIASAFDEIDDCGEPRPLVVMSQLAEGSDRLVAEAALARGASLIAFLPLPRDEYTQDFETQSSKDEFLRLLARAAEVHEGQSRADRSAAYRETGLAMLAQADLLLAVWDGQSAQGEGGTGEIVAEAARLGIPLAWVHAGNRRPGTSEPVTLGAAQGVLTTERLDPIQDAQRRRDLAASRFQERRWQYALFAVALSPLAALLLTVQSQFFPRGGPLATVLIGAELVALSLALAMGYLRMGQSHRRWIEERLRSEILRRERFLRSARVGPYLGGDCLDLPQRMDDRLRILDNDLRDPIEFIQPVDGDQTWLAALEDRNDRSGVADVPHLERKIRQYLEERVRDQVRYFTRKTELHARKARFYENASKIVLTLGLVLAAVHLGLLTATGTKEPGGIHLVIMLLAQLAPLVGSAFVGVQSVLGSHRLSRSYRVHARALERLERNLRHLTASDPRAAFLFQRAVLETEELLAGELRLWWLIISPQAPKAGG